MREAIKDWTRVFIHFLGFIVFGVALYFICVALNGCALTDQRYNELQQGIHAATVTAQGAAAAAGQPELVPIFGAAGAIATALAGLWHANSGLPGTKRRAYKKIQKGSASSSGM